ncbi:fimbrial isopeptide formation D2 family protein/LPXTG-motif cell wall-anchored protein [Agrococcus sp. UYP33]
MHTTTRPRGARLVAGFAAAAVGAFAAMGVIAPASAAPNIDPDQTGSITVHMFEQPATTGTPSDGRPLPSTSGLTPLAGVTFNAQRVTSIDLSSNTGWTTASGLTASEVIGDSIAYPLAAGTPDTTDSAGVATFTGLEIGVYLVQPTAVGGNEVALPTQPFLVSVPTPIEGDEWLYDVHVYPKASLTDITMSLDDEDAYELGDDITWTIDVLVPRQSEGDTISSFIVTDQLDATRLDLQSTTLRLGTTTLVLGTHYSLTEVDGLVTITFLPAGLTLLNASGGQTLEIALVTTVTALGDGTIENSANLYVNDTAFAAPFPSDTEISYWGAAVIVKHALGDEAALLDGAVFELRNSAGTVLETITVDGSYTIPGLRTTPAREVYTLTEIEAPTGYVLDATPRSFAVIAGPVASAVELQIANAQAPAFELPVTGGAGQTAFLIGGGALLAVALGALLVQVGRRRTAKQD